MNYHQVSLRDLPACLLLLQMACCYNPFMFCRGICCGVPYLNAPKKISPYQYPYHHWSASSGRTSDHFLYVCHLMTARKMGNIKEMAIKERPDDGPVFWWVGTGFVFYFGGLPHWYSEVTPDSVLRNCLQPLNVKGIQKLNLDPLSHSPAWYAFLYTFVKHFWACSFSIYLGGKKRD